MISERTFSKREDFKIKVRLVYVAICSLTGLVAGLNSGCSSQKGPLSFVVAEEVVTVEIQPAQFIKPAGQTVSSVDPAAIKTFLSVVNSAQPTEDHMCAHTLEITLKQKMKSDILLFVLHGHDSKYYEFRYGPKIYRVDRSEFESALTNLGASMMLDDSSS